MKDIEIRGEHIVHGIYIIVIVILAVALVFKTSDSNGVPIDVDDNEESDDDQTVRDSSVMIIKNANTNPSSTITVPSTSSSSSSTTSTNSNTQTNNGSTTQDTNQDSDDNQTEEEEPEEELLPITGEVTFSIDKITTEVKAEDWAKVVKIKFTITNQNPKNFYPKAEVYLWDDDDDLDMRNYVEEEVYFNKLGAGKEITVEKDVSVSFNEIEKEKTLKVILYDEDDEELDVVIDTFTAS
jgi:hypothetical protein